MKIVSKIIKAIFWAILFGLSGVLFGFVLGQALGYSIIQSMIAGAVGMGIIGFLYGIMIRTSASPEPQVPARSRYRLEYCAWCRGTGVEGKRRPKVCSVCQGKGDVLVSQPSLLCPNCKGKGRVFMRRRCKVCQGAGWDDYVLVDQSVPRGSQSPQPQINANS